MTFIISSVVFLPLGCLGLSTIGDGIGRVRELSSSIQTARVQLTQSTYLRDRSSSLVWVVVDIGCSSPSEALDSSQNACTATTGPGLQ